MTKLLKTHVIRIGSKGVSSMDGSPISKEFVVERGPMKQFDLPIGVLDSGVGGLTVLRSILKLLPQENLIYLADSLRMPYGDKDRGVLIQYALDAAHFLCEKGIKALVVACHTLSAQTLDVLEKTLSIPVIGVIQGGVKMLESYANVRRLAILGTKSTIASGVYQFLVHSKLPFCEVYPVACPMLAPKIEEILEEGKDIEEIISDYVNPLKETGIDTVLLGCTHYPLVRSIFEKILGKQVSLIDPSDVVALELKDLLEKQMQCNPGPRSKLEFFVTSSPEKFAFKAQLFLKTDVIPTQVEIARCH